MSDIYQIRVAQESDANFIFNSWMESYRKSFFAKFIPKFIFSTNHHELIKSTIQRSRVLCAVCIDDPNQIYGWVCVEPGETECLHYIYVKHTYRDLGIAKKLLANAITSSDLTFSHLAEHGLGKHLFSIAKYDPYRFLGGKK